ncbi:hypothetical protein [Clostridium tetani]|nr:hypothetical protein [Clostridium tetani]
MKWLQQLSHAIDYIQDNLENEISYVKSSMEKYEITLVYSKI